MPRRSARPASASVSSITWPSAAGSRLSGNRKSPNFNVRSAGGHDLREPPALAQRLDTARQAGRVIRFHEHATHGGLTLGRGKPLARKPVPEPHNSRALHHADDAIVVAAHADIGKEGGAAGQN